jgi:hypothetical protein
MRKTIVLVLLAGLSALATGAEDVYYHSTMPDGRVVVGDKPAPGAKEVRQMPLRAGNIIPSPPPPPAPAAPAGPGRQEQLNTADAEVRTAEQDLKAAQAALQAGQEPLPGERIGTAGGTSRLTDAYFQRIKRLEDAVAAAQKRLSDTQTKRNAAKY